jgi:hypothetical protein
VDVLARIVRWFRSRPGAQLVAGAIVLALVFPATPVGAICRVICYGALGIGVALGWPRLPEHVRQPAPVIAKTLVVVLVAILGIVVFWDVLTVPPDWQVGDWGPQHAVLARIMPSLPGLDIPVWNHAVSTGDAPLELYPALTYVFTGHFAWLFGLEGDLPLAFMIVATLVHVALAVTTAAITMRIAPKPLAFVVAALFLVDSGAISHGGTVGLFHWAILHSAFAHVFSMIAALGILAALKRPRIGASVAIWLGIAVSTAAHPAALITAAAYVLALAVVALLASDVAPRRALVAIGHVVLGVALGATVWLPSSERLLAYGQHFPNELFSGQKLLHTLFAFAMPISAYSLVVFAGYLGILTGMWTRRAEVIFIALVGLVMLVGLADTPYLAFGFAPSKSIARLGAIRMMLLARPFVFAIAAFTIAQLVRMARASWVGAPRRSRLVAAAVLGVMACSFCRIVPAFWREETQRAVSEAQQFAPDPLGRAQLVQWAQDQMRHVGPNAWARALFEEDTHEHMHLTALTGLPTFHMSPLPDLLLRERIESITPESLRRFNVKWVIAVGRPPSLGDPASEVVLGTYHIRTLSEWDGKFARIERGYGTIDVLRLDDRAVEIDVHATTPVLVALGTGYYPRWRATHASGADEPVYALPSENGAALHVVSAWVAPGRTVFTCDGPLPSDGDGRLLSALAALFAAAAIVVWRRTRWRIAVLRRLSRARQWAHGKVAVAIEFGLPALLAILVVRGCAEQLGRTEAVLAGSGARSVARVEARSAGGEWQECSYSPLSGEYHCDDIVTVSDTTVNFLNDAPPSWAFITPAISATSEADSVEIRVIVDARLSGRYWAGSTFGEAAIQVGNDAARDIGTHAMLDFDDHGEQTVTIAARVPDLQTSYVTIVAEDTLEPDRAFLAAPPAYPPPAISALVH